MDSLPALCWRGWGPLCRETDTVPRKHREGGHRQEAPQRDEFAETRNDFRCILALFTEGHRAVLRACAQLRCIIYIWFLPIWLSQNCFVMNEQVDIEFRGEAHTHRTVISTQFLFLCFLQMEDHTNGVHWCSVFIAFSKATSFFPFSTSFFHNLINLKLVLNSPCSWGWPETLVPASQVIGLWMCSIHPGFVGIKTRSLCF